MMRKLLLCIGIALAAIGCTKDATVTQTGDNVLSITSNIASRVTDGEWDESDAIGVYMTSTNLGDEGANKKYITTAGDGVFTSEESLTFPTSGTVGIFAYYPYDENVSITAYPIKSEDQIDLLSAKKDSVSSSDSPVDLTFDHLLSKITLTITAGTGLTSADLKALTVELSGISTTATFNLNNNGVTTTNSGGSLALTATTDNESEITSITLTDDESEITSITLSAIVIPQTIENAPLKFTTSKYGTFSTTLSTTFAVGKENTYTATLNGNSVVITSANISEWKSTSPEGTAYIADIEYKSDGKYYINSAKGLAAFRDLVNGASNTQSATYAGLENDKVNGDENDGVTFGTRHLDIDGVLTRNIDLAEICGANFGENSTPVSWTPIGISSNSTGSWVDHLYTGTFDGGGYEVKNLYISSASSQQALFRYIGKGGEVYNLGVTGEVTVTSTATDIYQAAGIAAKNYGFIINCYSEVDVVGILNVGGVAAYNEGNVVNCYNRGNITGSVNNVGGIVGQNEEGGYVGYCYSTGEVDLTATSDRRIGGVVGYNHSTTADAPTIKGSFCIESENTDYSIGQVKTSESSGGLTGNVCTEEYLKSASFVTTINNGSATYNSDTSNNPPIAACEWVYNSGDYPTLNFGTAPTTVVLDISFNSLSYNINTEKGLQAFAALVNGEEMPADVVTSGDDIYFKFGTAQPNIDGRLTANIDLSKICSASSTTSWTPIGKYTSDETPEIYSGTFEGNGYEVQNLYISSSSDYQGLFGYVGAKGVVSNLGVSGYITSYNSISLVAGVVGNNLGLVINCYNKVEIASNCYIVGGVVGLNDVGGFVVNCYNQGKVAGTTYVGGIIGKNEYTSSGCGSLICSYNTGEISGVTGVGGCVGYNVSDGSTGGATVSDSYYLSSSTTNVIGTGYGAGSANIKTASEMQALNTTLNKNAASYNADTSSAVAACGWKAGDSYPVHVYGSTPQSDGTYKVE